MHSLRKSIGLKQPSDKILQALQQADASVRVAAVRTWHAALVKMQGQPIDQTAEDLADHNGYLLAAYRGDECPELRADGFVEKPFSPENLLAAVRRAAGFIVFGFRQLRKSALPDVSVAGQRADVRVHIVAGECRVIVLLVKIGAPFVEKRPIQQFHGRNTQAAFGEDRRRLSDPSIENLPGFIKMFQSGRISSRTPAANVSMCFDTAWASCPSSFGTLGRSDSGPKNRG